MKALVDTCGWIEWLTDGPAAQRFQPYLANPELVVVPTIVQYELYKWVCRERDEETACDSELARLPGVTFLGPKR